MTENKELIQAIIEGAQEKKAHQIVHMDMSEIESASTGDFVICTGNSTQHVDAVPTAFVNTWKRNSALAHTTTTVTKIRNG